MRLVFRQTKPWVFAAGVLVGIVAAYAAKPLYQYALESLIQEEFYRLTEECDAAMRVHLIAKNRLELDPAVASVSALLSAELGLLSCQDYDLMRKRLIRFGLDENALSRLTLSFAEARAKDLKLVVETHEFRY